MIEPIKLTNFILNDSILEQIKKPGYIEAELEKQASPQKIAGFNNESMAEFYRAAKKLFDAHKYQEAGNAFLFLVFMNSSTYEYWLGYGMSMQMQNAFETAIDAYESAAILEAENPVPYFYLAKCLFALHDRQNAREAIKLAIEYAGENSQYDELKAQAKAVESLLELEE